MRLKPFRFDTEVSREVEQTAPDEFNVHSFIVKVWIEGDASEDGGPAWYGRITNVPGGEQHYLRDLSEIETVVGAYLKAAGIRFGLRERIRRWLRLRNHS